MAESKIELPSSPERMVELIAELEEDQLGRVVRHTARLAAGGEWGRLEIDDVLGAVALRRQYFDERRQLVTGLPPQPRTEVIVERPWSPSDVLDQVLDVEADADVRLLQLPPGDRE